MPSRADLGRWLSYARSVELRLQGASDHIVSEAFYLSDPEGNGIEIYADRPVSRWRNPAASIKMATGRLNVNDLLKLADGTDWPGFPEGGNIGHVHLQVGDTAVADRFYRDVLGFDVAVDYPGATFYGSGGYHHQLAGNVWNKRDAVVRPSGMAGVDEVEIIAHKANIVANVVARASNMAVVHRTQGSEVTLLDPWGIAIRIRA